MSTRSEYAPVVSIYGFPIPRVTRPPNVIRRVAVIVACVALAFGMAFLLWQVRATGGDGYSPPYGVMGVCTWARNPEPPLPTCGEPQPGPPL